VLLLPVPYRRAAWHHQTRNASGHRWAGSLRLPVEAMVARAAWLVGELPQCERLSVGAAVHRCRHSRVGSTRAEAGTHTGAVQVVDCGYPWDRPDSVAGVRRGGPCGPAGAPPLRGARTDNAPALRRRAVLVRVPTVCAPGGRALLV
jgi:hypothetical protein